MEYAIYANRCYRLGTINGKEVSLVSTIKWEGFSNYIDILGKVQDDFFIRKVSQDDLDFAYRAKYLVDYQGHTFETLADVGKRLLGQDKLYLYTEDREIAKNLGFETYDNGSFDKGIYLRDIDRVTELKIPILRFKGMETTQTIIEKDQIMDYIINLIE